MPTRGEGAPVKKVKELFKGEAVLAASFLLAAVSALAVKPSAAYADYVDFRTISLLFCLMAVMAGLAGIGVFRLLAAELLSRVKTVRGLSLTLCLLCFFSSMLITNDVALITFVPFSVTALRLSGKTEKMIWLVTLETVAANLGSMLTPVGNPQNLYLFSAYNMSGKEFFTAVVPYAGLSLAALCLLALFSGRDEVSCTLSQQPKPRAAGVAVYCALFALSLLTVLHAVPYAVTLGITLAVLLFFDRRALAAVDYSLLLTFVFLFIFIGNLGQIEPVSDFLHRTVVGREVAVGVLASQVFSNVPAAILLSGFTQNARMLLVGVNIGGLGTLIASMASLISFKLIVKEKIGTGKYTAVFTAVNVIFLALNLALYAIIR